MIPSLTIAAPDWMTADNTLAVMRALNGDGKHNPVGQPAALFVGGCVRNALTGEAVTDIDIATILTPPQVINILKAADIKVIPTGIEHGTVTAVINRDMFEITTLRRDVETDGRRAVVAFSTDWAEDAARRDFTINTLLADTDGHIYDPLGDGLRDLQAGQVIFVGRAAERVAEDYLRILRFFRFHARYGRGAPDDGALAACRAGADKLALLSRERITDEFLKILSVDSPVEILEMMFENGILTQFPAPAYKAEALKCLVLLQKDLGVPDSLPRLAVLAGFDRPHLSMLSQYIVLSNEKWQRLDLYAAVEAAPPGPREAKLWIYRHGADVARQMVLLGLARTGRDAVSATVREILASWRAPKLPVSGADVIAAGVAEGPEIGRVIQKIETWWIENDYAPDRQSCLRQLEACLAS